MLLLFQGALFIGFTYPNLIQQGVECRILTHDGLHDLAVRTHNYLGWETLDTIFIQKLATLGL